MTIVALALTVGLVVTVTVFTGLIRGQQRAHARREDLLLNQLLHAIGTPWQTAPADVREPVKPVEPKEVRYTMSPEHFPTDYRDDPA